MNENNNKQTLFRFVSLRNPNLVETKKTNLAFIQRPDEFKGAFDYVLLPPVATQTKSEALLLAISNFVAKNTEDLEKGVFSALIMIGKSISNQKELLPAELSICKQEYLTLKDSVVLSDVWDNFIYQFLTQKDFYAKETLAYILKALHIGYVQTLDTNDELNKLNGDDFVKTAINGTIVIPLSILGKETISFSKKLINENKELSNKEISLLTLGLEDFEKEQNVLEEKENLKQLKSEIESIKNTYWVNYENEQKAARSSYEKEHAVNLKAYEDQLYIVNQLEESKDSEEKIAEAYEVLESYEVPSFKFSYKDELNWDDIYSQLSEESLAYFLENFSNAEQNLQKEVDLKTAEVNVADSSKLSIDGNSFSLRHTSYDDIITEINTKANSFSTIALNQTSLQQNEYANVGGVVVPISNSNSVQTRHLSYVLKTNRLSFFLQNMGYATFQIHVENSSWSVSNAIISATTSTDSYTENIGAISVVNNKINFPQFLRNKVLAIGKLSIQIFFSNGREATLELTKVTSNVPYTGILSLKAIISDDPIDPIDPAEPTPTAGKHFGLKRLGVAEYMKVTQSVHAYVPGEVSNIENVMASELRHKSINELTRTEDTVTTSKSQEIEKVSDTTKVNRAEMQTEVAKEIDKQRSFNAHANFSKNDLWKVDVGTAYASANAQHISNRQAVTKSQEVTERAMESVQSKISEERISKIIQEVSLTNVHEYDNRGTGDTAPKHITGVYRWVDKKMKNQIYNYGKRTMFEFMIPEPAKLHRLAIATTKNILTAPVDPRKTAVPHTMKNATSATKQLLEYWADKYGVQLTAEPQNKQQIHKAMAQPGNRGEGIFFDSSFDVLEDYVAKSAVLDWNFIKQINRDWGLKRANFDYSNLKGGFYNFTTFNLSNSGSENVYGLNLSDTFSYIVKGANIGSLSVNIKLNCEPSLSLVNAWKLENFNAIIEAYQTALNTHNEEVARIEAEQAAKAAEQKDVLGNFYRIIEGDIIKHNCVAYLLQNYLTSFGQDFTDGDKMLDFKVNLGSDLDKYTAKAKFLEQAFEWSIMDYTFYSYFWADRNQWQDMYLSENTDTLFRSFLQSGLARVIVTVKPGFEEAVQYFLETGNVWLGGETPVIGDPLYMSIAQEMIEPTGVPQGKYWITRIPTTLTILQANSAGLEVEKALPIFPEDEPENCENPEQLETESAFTLDKDAQLMAGKDGSTTLYSGGGSNSCVIN